MKYNFRFNAINGMFSSKNKYFDRLKKCIFNFSYDDDDEKKGSGLGKTLLTAGLGAAAGYAAANSGIFNGGNSGATDAGNTGSTTPPPAQNNLPSPPPASNPAPSSITNNTQSTPPKPDVPKPEPKVETSKPQAPNTPPPAPKPSNPPPANNQSNSQGTGPTNNQPSKNESKPAGSKPEDPRFAEMRRRMQEARNTMNAQIEALKKGGGATVTHGPNGSSVTYSGKVYSDGKGGWTTQPNSIASNSGTGTKPKEVPDF